MSRSLASRSTLLAPPVTLTSRSQQLLETRRNLVLRPYFAQLAKRGSSRVNIVCLGDSLTTGGKASSWLNAWPRRLNASLRQRYLGGAAGGHGFIATDWPGPPNFTAPSIVAASLGTNNSYGPIRRTVQMSTASHSATLTVPTGTSADVMYVGNGGNGIGYYQVDGGSTVTFDTTRGSLLDGVLTRASLGTTGAHTVKVGWSSGGSVYIDGYVHYDGDETSGITVHNCGYWGQTSSGWNTGGFGTTGWPSAIKALAPSLLFITIGTNDFSTSITPALFQTNVTAMISNMRGALTAPYPPVVLQMVHERSDAGTYPWTQYLAAARAIEAADSQVVVLDNTLRLAKVGTDSLGFYSDTVHLSDAGHQYMADFVESFIAPR